MRRRLLLMVVVVVLTVAACGDDDAAQVDTGTLSTAPAASDRSTTGSDPGFGAETDLTELEDRAFRATSITEDGRERPLVEGTELSLRFRWSPAPADGALSATAGCNHVGGELSVDGDTVTIADLSMTEMGCGPDLTAQDEWISDILSEPLTMSLDGNELTVITGRTVVIFRDLGRTEPSRPRLVGSYWTVDTIVHGDVASSVPAGVPAALTFADDGTYTVDTGCNTGEGTYVDEGETLAIQPPGLTRQRCSGPAGEAEVAVVTVLDGDVTYEIDEDRLTLTGEDQGRGLGLIAS